MDPNHKLVDLFNKQVVIEKLRDKVVSDTGSESVKILAEIDELKSLPQYLSRDFI